MSFKPEVIGDSSGQWCGNALRFATREEAEANVRDLVMRCSLCARHPSSSRTIPSTTAGKKAGSSNRDRESRKARRRSDPRVANAHRMRRGGGQHAAAVKASHLDETLVIVREAMPDETATIISNVAYSLMQRSKLQCK
jgi:hypothetical protein